MLHTPFKWHVRHRILWCVGLLQGWERKISCQFEDVSITLNCVMRHSSFPSTISPWQWKGKKEKFVSSGFSPCWGYFLWMNGDLGAGYLSWGQRLVWSIHVTSYTSISSSSWAMPHILWTVPPTVPQRPPGLSPPLYYCDSLVSLRICVMKFFSPLRHMRGRISGSTGKSVRKFLKNPSVLFFPILSLLISKTAPFSASSPTFVLSLQSPWSAPMVFSWNSPG